MVTEPEILKKGKQFHKHVQIKWAMSAGGLIKPEESVPRKNKRNGRADIFVEDIGDDTVSIVEIKKLTGIGSNWRTSLETLKDNPSRYGNT